MLLDEFQKSSDQSIWINQTYSLTTTEATLHIGSTQLQINAEYFDKWYNLSSARIQKAADGTSFLATSVESIDGDSSGVALMEIREDGSINDIYVVNEQHSGNQRLLDFKIYESEIWVLYSSTNGVRYAKYDLELNKLADAVAVDNSIVTKGISKFLFSDEKQVIISTIRPADSFSSTSLAVTEFDQTTNLTTPISMDSIHASELQVHALDVNTAIAAYLRSSGGYDVFLGKIDLNTGEILSENRANFIIFGDQVEPELTKLSDGKFLLSWSVSGSTTKLYGRIIDQEGDFTTLDIKFDLEGYKHSISASDDGGFVVVSRDGDTIKASKFNSNLELIETTSTIMSRPFSSLETPISNGIDDNFDILAVNDSNTATVNKIQINNTPAGYIELIGSIEQGSNISVASFISDLDGYDQENVKFSWLMNGTVIQSSVRSNLFLDQSHVGQNLTLQLDFTDFDGTKETMTFALPSSVQNVNDAPTGSLTIAGIATQGNTLTAENTLADLDGLGELYYQWKADGVNIANATSSTLILGQAQVGKTIKVEASYTDGYGTDEQVYSGVSSLVQNVNDAPTGSLTIAGIATQGNTLTAENTLADLDGLGELYYQWKADGVNIANATSSTLMLSQDEVGKTITVAVNYTDIAGADESITSAPTAHVEWADIELTTRTVDRFGKGLTSDALVAYEITGSEQVVLREISTSNANSVFEIVANPTEAVSSIDFDLIDNVGLIDFQVSAALSDWSIQINTNNSDTVSVAGFSAVDGSQDFAAGQETVIATFTTSTEPDFIIDGIVINQTVQHDIYFAEVAPRSQIDNLTVYEIARGSDVHFDADKRVDEASSGAVTANDALQALRLAVGLTKSDGTAEWHDYIAADINKDGQVTANDALNILKLAVGLHDADPAAWIFVDSSGDWSGIAPKNTIYDKGVSLENVVSDMSFDFTGILIGDVDGSYSGLVA